MTIKKFAFTLMLMLVTAVAVNAQSLTGKQWCTVFNDEDGASMDNLKIVTLQGKKLVLKNDDNQEIPFYAE